MTFIPDPPIQPWTPDPQPCQHPNHFPPGMWVPPGPGTWVCPGCGHKSRIGTIQVTC